MMRNAFDLNMKVDTTSSSHQKDKIVTENGGMKSPALAAPTKPEYKGRSMKGKGHGSLSEVEPYVAFLFRHWDKTAKANPGFDGQAVQELLWRQWVSLESVELANRQRSEVKMNTGKRRRESEGAMVVADLVSDLVSEMLHSITEAEDVASQLIEELLNRVCPRNKGIFYEHMAKTVLGEVKGAELGLMEIRDAEVLEELSRRLGLRS